MLLIQYVLYNLPQDSKTFPLAWAHQYMLRKESKAVSEGSDPVYQEKEFGFGQPAPVDEFREIKSLLEQWMKKLDEFHDDMNNLLKQFSARLEHFLEQDARQRRYAMETDDTTNTKTRERTESAATAVQVMRGDSFTARRVEPGPNTSSTSFGVKAEPPALPCRDDVVVESGDTPPKLCLPSWEMRSSTAAGGLVPAGETSTAETTVNKRLLQFYSTEVEDSKKGNVWTSTPSTWYDSSFWKLLAASYCQEVNETKLMQNRTFDPGGSQGHPRACPFLESWRALVCGEVARAGAAG